LQHAFLHALETCGCVGPGTGWAAHHLGLWQGEQLLAAQPLYIKSHSYGEYVFDWAWAEAWERAGGRYYPKLLCAIPFTPVTGQRLLAGSDALRGLLLDTLLDYFSGSGLSSLHCLFPTADDAGLMRTRGGLERSGFQYHWENPGYASFEAFLATLTRDKRKKIRQERRRVADAGVDFRQLRGTDITPPDWAFFHQCYTDTYRRHHSQPYLNLAFFLRLGEVLAGHCLLVIAEHDGHPVASALNIISGDTLYGRYWGALAELPGLHFETCYYQGMEYCIHAGLRRFEGGAQGEHKLARGFMPVPTRSYHWLADARLHDAVAHFVAREGQAVAHYVSEIEGPYRKDEPC
jgi:predicted N-acyltransferase